MKHWVWLIPLVAACASDDLATNEVEQNAGDYQAGDYQSGDYQAGDYQAGDYQAGDYQAGDYQGAHYASSSFSDATQNGVALQDITISGTTLTVWKKIKTTTWPYYGWEQRSPNRICTWAWDKSHATCLVVDPSTTASPLAGVRFKTTLRTATGTMTGTVQIGASSTAVNAVKQDKSYAMWMLTNIYNAGPWSTSQNPPVNCTNPAGCRQNTDLWTYDLKLINTDGSQLAFCSSGQSYALKGVWDKVGTYSTTDPNLFTFACSTGTIAKCTRWGYRPWVTSYTKSDGTQISFGDYHQACIRAAMADYCANGHTFTKYHTLIDIFDYDGFIPNLNALYPTATAFIWESDFDMKGASQLDFTRYQELTQDAGYGSITSPAPIGCPGTFNMPVAPVDPRDSVHIPFQRDYDTWQGRPIGVRSTPVCSHTEYTVGKYLHPKCSGCTMHLAFDHPDPETDYSYCTNPGDPKGWDIHCVQAANQYCGWDYTNPHHGTSKMAGNHGECTGGDPLRIYATACTADVCKDSGYESCCTSNWSASCVAHANDQCKGGQEHSSITGQYGFCNQPVTLQNAP